MIGKILVVDDIPANIKVLEAKLAKEYYTIITAKDGFEAIEKTKEHKPDIILLDVMMPGMDGFEACKKIKSDPEFSHTPIVMVTALSEQKDKNKGLASGADEFLTKPVNDTELFARIKSLTRMNDIYDALFIKLKTGAEFGIIEKEIMDYSNNIGGMKIMIADDDIAQREKIEKSLNDEGYEIKSIDNFDNIFNDISQNDSDLIILNANADEYDALQLCAQIRGNESIRYVGILFLIDSIDEDEEGNKLIQKGLELGANDYIKCPPDSAEIIARVRTNLKRKRYSDALNKNFDDNMTKAIKDSLTGLHNRSYFDKHLDTLINAFSSEGKSMCLALLDIDHFKKVNDELGHVAGDEILKQMSKLIQDNVRQTDLVARYGGEEIAIIMSQTSIKDATDVAERVRKMIEQFVFKISAGDGTLQKTVSIGVTQVKQGDVAQSIIERADKCLYYAKENGRNRVIFGE